MLKKMMIVAATGIGAVYLLDPNKGPDRRQRALRLWAENKEQILGLAGWAAGTGSALGSTTEKKVDGIGGNAGVSKDPNTAIGGISEHVVTS